MSAPEWSGTPLDQALSLVEAVARKHGYASPRCPSIIASDIAAMETRFGFPVPTDLRAFLLWHDPDLWSYFVNPDRALVSDRRVITTSGEVISADHPLNRSADCPRISSPEPMDGGALKPDVFGHFAGMFIEYLDDLGRPESWRQARAIAFGTSGYFEPLVYVIDSTDSPAGAIVTFSEDHEDRMWLADSLGAWLARMVACDGCEYAFMPGDFKSMPSPLRSEYVREFRRHNPRSSFFR